ncbi:hypothetical protein [Paraflavitalea sp. CAU 1676]|uniref:hypothetical protein n=1 Tax=Paraflavitalea sp. CAU 1676 TaxID=3032598 RepID=UPI0023DCE53A|nr:hypothetical protein [Paraflavitalea sp. CAU 1676]MDF2190509.1 hypothetical protein [Paraflavitalea sp. CAU 1676]
MQDIEGIIREHARILRDKGYNEKALNNGEEDGMYKTHLRIAVQDILDKDIVLFDNEHLSVKMFGSFNHGQDKVLFDFTYEFNSFNNSLTLKQLEATLNKVPLAIHIDGFEDLWHSRDIYERLKEFSININQALDYQERQVKSEVIKSFASCITELGYENASIKPPGWIHRKLNKIDQSVSMKDKTRHFFNLQTDLKGDLPYGPIRTKIHCLYIPEIPRINTTGLFLQIQDCKHSITLKPGEQIPSVKEVTNLMQNKLDLARARSITDACKLKETTSQECKPKR